jgi:hypothetical protein
VSAEEAVAGTADDDQVRVLVLGERDERGGERLAHDDVGGGRDAVARQRRDGAGDPLLALVDQ